MCFCQKVGEKKRGCLIRLIKLIFSPNDVQYCTFSALNINPYQLFINPHQTSRDSLFPGCKNQKNLRNSAIFCFKIPFEKNMRNLLF